MPIELEGYFLNPPAGSAAQRAIEFGTDLTLTLENLRLTPEERVRKLEGFIEGVAKLKASIRVISAADANAKKHH
jgi:hypothetical protein